MVIKQQIICIKKQKLINPIKVFFYLFLLPTFLFTKECVLPTKKDIRILILIITSDNLAVYKEEINIWRSYMHSIPNHIEAYFIRADPNLKNQFKFQGDTIYTKTKEDFIPGIFNKTLLSLCGLEEQIMKKFDFVLRTNLSSFFVLSRLVNYCEKISKKKYFGGYWMYGYGCWFMRGSFMLFSSDIVLKMIQDKNNLFSKKIVLSTPDDIAISRILKNYGVSIDNIGGVSCQCRGEWCEFINNIIPENVIYFRCKNNNPKCRQTQELYYLKSLRQMYYPNWELGLDENLLKKD